MLESNQSAMRIKECLNCLLEKLTGNSCRSEKTPGVWGLAPKTNQCKKIAIKILEHFVSF